MNLSPRFDYLVDGWWFWALGFIKIPVVGLLLVAIMCYLVPVVHLC